MNEADRTLHRIFEALLQAACKHGASHDDARPHLIVDPPRQGIDGAGLLAIGQRRMTTHAPEAGFWMKVALVQIWP